MDPENRDTPGGSNYRVISRKRLYDKMQEQNLPNLEEKLNYLENELLTHGITKAQNAESKQTTSHHVRMQLQDLNKISEEASSANKRSDLSFISYFSVSPTELKNKKLPGENFTAATL
ncbi:unnamed protein product [Acanthoscelides obtectus]|uniref:Uncharacterized protein n=1 Tax=Acanthoscelides obtectus TaxID=200917 RepID=A0A9P0LX37_ACAOB|nr:unnamed protein product [Acanthoscelides obtectus]CAK1662768.1 hypothetical protein AOBTE_LOCUS23300 [Acanthoscelides obtectus]